MNTAPKLPSIEEGHAHDCVALPVTKLRGDTTQTTVRDYLSMTKPRIGLMVLVVTSTGYFLASGGFLPVTTLFFTLLGTYLSCCGSAVLNNFIERDNDRKMERTKNRSLPAGRISPANALAFGVILVLLGVAILALQVNLLTAFLALLTSFLYVVVYTPLKKVSWLNTAVGAIPGALPPVGGWAAATGGLDIGAWVLFSILFIWQHPHFFAIAWIYREDYRRGGLKMLPCIDETRTFSQVLFHCLLLMPVSLLPIYFGASGGAYFWGALLLGTLFLWSGIRFIVNATHQSAKRLLHASLFYLPGLLIFAVIDHSLI